MIKYSIIIPHINEGFLLNITLDSIYNRFKRDDFEVIIIDDGSDNLSDLEFTQNHFLGDKIKLFFEKNLGSSRARNFGAEKSKGEFLIFLDSHMYFIDNFIDNLDIILSENKFIDILQPVIGSITNKKYYGKIYCIKDDGLNSTWKSQENSNDLVLSPNIAGGATIIKKEIFYNLDGFNKNFIKWGSEDLDLSMRANLSGYNCYLTTKLFVAHYFKESFKNTVVLSENVLNNKIMFIYTCFSNGDRVRKIFEKLKHDYGLDFFNNIHSKVLDNNDFWFWLKNQKNNFKYDDNWYFDKFNYYYNGLF